MPLPPAFLDDLRTRLPLSEVIAKRIPVQRAGREYKACCPFHNEKTPSFSINDTKGFFHCFGCGAHGDVIGFTMRYDRLSFPEAIESLAALAGLEVPRLSREEVKQAEEQKTLHQLCEAACQWFEQQLKSPRGRAGLDYLHGRGLTDEIIAKFRLGYAPADGAALIAHLKAQKFEVAQMIEVGLARQSERDSSIYSFFRDRVMFPVTDRRGRVVAFGGRIMSGDGPKYINSPDHPLFHKGKLLYSLARARDAAPRGAPVIVSEGYMDVIALVEAGFGAAVAPLGTALTEEQIAEVWKLGNAGGPPILSFDGDTAGQRAAARAVDRILPELGPDRTVRIAFMPEGEDPDSLIKQGGAKAMQAVLDGAISLVDMLWKLESAGRALDTPEDKAGLKAALEGRAATIKDKAVQGYYRTALAEKLDSAFGWKPRRYQADKNGRWNNAKTVPSNLKMPAKAAEMRQRILLATILNHPAAFSALDGRLSTQNFAPVLDNLRQAVVSALENNPELDRGALHTILMKQGYQENLDQLLTERVYNYAPWARPHETAEKALQALQGMLAVDVIDAMKAEFPAAERQLVRDETETGLARVAAVRNEVVEAVNAALPRDEQGTKN